MRSRDGLPPPFPRQALTFEPYGLKTDRMEKAKLTLSLPKSGIQRAKRHAKSRNTTVSGLVNRFFLSLEDPAEQDTPLTKAATGLAKLPEGKTAQEVIEEALMEKYL